MKKVVQKFTWSIETLNIEKHRLMSLLRKSEEEPMENVQEIKDKLAEVDEAIDTLTPEEIPKWQLKIHAITETLCQVSGHLLKDVRSHSRKNKLVNVRKVVVYFVLKYADNNLTQIAGYFDVDHTTVLNLKGRIKKQIDSKDKAICHFIAEAEPLIIKLKENNFVQQ